MTLDELLTQSINAPAGDMVVLDTAMRWITLYGVPLLVLAVVPLWWASSNRPYQRHTAISAAFSLLSGLAINQSDLLWVSMPALESRRR